MCPEIPLGTETSLYRSTQARHTLRRHHPGRDGLCTYLLDPLAAGSLYPGLCLPGLVLATIVLRCSAMAKLHADVHPLPHSTSSLMHGIFWVSPSCMLLTLLEALLCSCLDYHPSTIRLPSCSWLVQCNGMTALEAPQCRLLVLRGSNLCDALTCCMRIYACLSTKQNSSRQRDQILSKLSPSVACYWSRRWMPSGNHMEPEHQ